MTVLKILTSDILKTLINPYFMNLFTQVGRAEAVRIYMVLDYYWCTPILLFSSLSQIMNCSFVSTVISHLSLHLFMMYGWKTMHQAAVLWHTALLIAIFRCHISCNYYRFTIQNNSIIQGVIFQEESLGLISISYITEPLDLCASMWKNSYWQVFVGVILLHTNILYKH